MSTVKYKYMENHPAKHFTLQLGSLISLYLSLSFLITLLFGLINFLFPDAAENYWEIEGASEKIRIGIAMTIVFFPTYLILTKTVNKARRNQIDGSYLGLTKWLIYLSLLIGGAVLLGDLVAVIMGYLEGDLTTRFFLKALTVLIIVGLALQYYLLDIKNYWLKNEKRVKIISYIVGIIVFSFIVAGFLTVDSPNKVREMKLDETQISDLQDIQWRVQEYLTLNETLPTTLNDLQGEIPNAPENRPSYIYSLTENGFSLCATFEYQSKDQNLIDKPYYYVSDSIAVPSILNPDNWEHPAGEYCFERVLSTAKQ